jgi:uncharacterized repeat protein (TIGR03803 family)
MGSKHTIDAERHRLGSLTRGRKRRTLWLGCVAGLAIAFGAGETAHAAAKLQVLMSFGNARGSMPLSAPVADGVGNLYVTGRFGGAHGDGAVVELSPPTSGMSAWTKTVLYAFRGSDGAYPSTGLALDAAGNLYGVTDEGGANNCGVVFELSPPAQGDTAWKQTVLHAFGGADGSLPQTTLLADGAGGFYGTTTNGGVYGDGSVFELSPPAPGETVWNETVLHSFRGADGMLPQGSLMADGAGNLYGTARQGGANDYGVVYELNPPPAGQTNWTETVLHSFDGADGQYTLSSLMADAAGNLYGTAGDGGAHGHGVVFELISHAGGADWKEKVLHAFNESHGAYPTQGVIADRSGNLYGTTVSGGRNDNGVVFELSPPVTGEVAWTERVLHYFDLAHGQNPYAGLVADASGNLYGTTVLGGQKDAGVVFKLAP